MTVPLSPKLPPDLSSHQSSLRPSPSNLPTPVSPKSPPRSFDQSLESLERNRVITPLERKQLQTGSMATPIPSSKLKSACQTGALSKRECDRGVALSAGGRRAMTRFRMRRKKNGYGWADPSPLTPLTVPVSALLAGEGGGFRLDSVFAVTPKPQPLQGNGDSKLLFPIIGSAFTSSGFGWRMHPIIGRWLMHAGKDFAAPEGTPVVAAMSGRVVSSGLAGGYGIAIELEHQKPLRRTLYGHLSEIYVKSGQQVRQGEVIGRVGSTGLSTGPHLHFEFRRPDGKSWVAIDPGELDLNPLTATNGDPISLLIGQLLDSLERQAG